MDKYAVFGHPIAQSKSPYIHTLFARQTGQQMSYEAILAPLDGFQTALDDFLAAGGRGCNITVPFKEQAYRAATQLTERARLAGAVNTLKLLDDGVLLGDNTDGEGLVQDLLAHQVTLENQRILLIGAGGAARGVILPLLAQNPQQLVIANRTYDKAQALADTFATFGNITAMDNETLALQDGFDVVINSTSASLSGSVPDVPTSVITHHSCCYDMVYGAQPTAFNNWTSTLGASKNLDGLGMLVGQAAESFMLWRGLRPGAKQVQRELRRSLQGK
ncbi:shikimate dehydrogenase [Photobacterium damselae]|uniref:shikimate dehydrogenase n=1 Tax=Photobacterium damselae TaxID=38293 RepID=UPI0040684855